MSQSSVIFMVDSSCVKGQYGPLPYHRSVDGSLVASVLSLTNKGHWLVSGIGPDLLPWKEEERCCVCLAV